MSYHYFHHSKAIRGFGLIELMVSISIMMLVAGIILIHQNSFNGAVLLESQAYEIGLAIREVQQSAVSASTNQGGNREMLGVYFDTNRNTTYRIFRDDENNGSYEAAEEYGQQNSLDSRFEIKGINVCSSSCSSQTAVSVMFERPNFDAKFYVGNTQTSASYVEVQIGTKDNSAAIKTVIVTATGQITIQ